MCSIRNIRALQNPLSNILQIKDSKYLRDFLNCILLTYHFILLGKLNLSLEDLKKAMASETEELWLVKLPKNFRPDRMEGQEIKFPSEKKSEKSETKTSLDLKNNGVIQNAIVTANTFSLPFVCPKKDKELISVRKEHGLKLEKAIQNRDEAVQDLEEDANAGECKLFLHTVPAPINGAAYDKKCH